MSNDHPLCVAAFEDAVGMLSQEQREQLAGSTVSVDEGTWQGQFRAPDGFYWQGSVHCEYDAMQLGIRAWLRESDDDETYTAWEQKHPRPYS